MHNPTNTLVGTRTICDLCRHPFEVWMHVDPQGRAHPNTDTCQFCTKPLNPELTKENR